MAKNNEESGTATEGKVKMTGSEAVRKAFEKMGRDAMPVAVQKYVKDAFKIDITTNLVSNVKAKLKGKSGKTPSPAKAQGATKAAAGPKAQAKPSAAKSGGSGQATTGQAKNGQTANRNGGAAGGNGQGAAGISLEDIDVIKQLARRNGAASLHRLIDLLVK